MHKNVNYFDLGTYNGAEIKLFVDICKEFEITNYNIYGFEPNKDMYSYLKKNFVDDHIKILNIAVSDSNRPVKLYHDGKRGQGDSIFSTKSNVHKDKFDEVEGVLFSDWILKTVHNFKESFNMIRFNIEGAEWFLMQDIVKSGLLEYVGFFGGSPHGEDIPKVVELKDKLDEYHKLLDSNKMVIHPFDKIHSNFIGNLILKGVKNE